MRQKSGAGRRSLRKKCAFPNSLNIYKWNLQALLGRMTNSARASAPGKLILFGEHIVIYGEPAIATALDKRAYVTATELENKKIVVRSKDLGTEIEASFKEQAKDPIVRAAQVALEKTKANKGVQIEINSEIPISVGLGSSASVSVATAAAVLKLFSEKEPSKFEIMTVAHEAEKIAHGNPSGVDTAITTFGGTIFFKKGEIEGLDAPQMEIVIGNTKVSRNTKEIVENVKKIVEDPRVAYNLFTISSIVKRAREALLRSNLTEVGHLMNKNQEFLRALGVSSVELEQLIQIANQAGAYDAKLTGAGGGGCMIALTDMPEKIQDALNKNGAEAFIAKTNQQGVKYE